MESSTGNNPSRRSRLSRFVFTLNNYTQEEEAAIQALQVKWIIYGREVGENGTRHLQGACVIGKQTSFSSLKMWPGLRRCHIEKMIGTPDDSRRYCSKQDTAPFESGILPTQGKRNDLIDTIGKMREGKSLRQIVADDESASCVVKYHKGLTTLRALLATPRCGPPEVYWLCGSTGVGKTRSAVEYSDIVYGPGNFWISSGKLKWFDGYDQQKCAIFDDLRVDSCDFDFLLRILDRYPVNVEFKGGHVNFAPLTIIITAPHLPKEIYLAQYREALNQLERRITLHITVTEPGYNGNYLLLDTQSIRAEGTKFIEWKPDPDAGGYFPDSDNEEGLSLIGKRDREDSQESSVETTQEYISPVKMNDCDSPMRKRRKVCHSLDCPLYDNHGNVIDLTK